jgi:hypothetical protein
MAENRTRHVRRSFSVADKVEAVKWKLNKDKELRKPYPVTAAARKFNMDANTFRSWIENYDVLRQMPRDLRTAHAGPSPKNEKFFSFFRARDVAAWRRTFTASFLSVLTLNISVSTLSLHLLLAYLSTL